MAHIIELPFAIEFTPEKRAWEVCTATRAGLVQDFMPKASGVWTLPSLMNNKQIAIQVARTSSAKILRPSLTPKAIYSVHHSWGQSDALTNYFEGEPVLSNLWYSKDISLEILVSFESRPTKLRSVDPWEMRKEFLSLPRKTTALAKFLNRWGAWDGTTISKVGEQYKAIRLEEMAAHATHCVLPHVMWDLQAKFKAALSGNAEEWLSQNVRIPTLRRRTLAPFFAIRDLLCLTAIETTITLDKIREVPYRLCQRTDCDEVFKLESNHSRLFCSQACAHLVSVRRSREAKRKSEAKEKS